MGEENLTQFPVSCNKAAATIPECGFASLISDTGALALREIIERNGIADWISQGKNLTRGRGEAGGLRRYHRKGRERTLQRSDGHSAVGTRPQEQVTGFQRGAVRRRHCRRRHCTRVRRAMCEGE